MADIDPAPSLPVTYALMWDETATRLYYNDTLRLEWKREFGDHDGTVVGSAPVPLRNGSPTVSIPVTGNEFLVDCAGTNILFASREAPVVSDRPRLVVNGVTYKATRDTRLSPSSVSPQGNEPQIRCPGNLLLGFDEYSPKSGDRATLMLAVIKSYQNSPGKTLNVYRPAITQTQPPISSRPATRIIANITPSDFRLKPGQSVQDGIITGRLASDHRTVFGQLFAIPPADEYYLTVVMKLGQNWPNFGGKLPGLTNTGQATSPANLTVNGQNCNHAGWGGRKANGCRWSARTGWTGRSSDMVGFSTYYYALQTGSLYGKGIGVPSPMQAGRWFAYVQRVKVNSAGSYDGRLSYWFCDETGCRPTFDKSDILFRTSTVAQSKITEVWADVYCGGTDCGPTVIEPSYASIKRLTVTDGLPDLNAISAEVRQLRGR